MTDKTITGDDHSIEEYLNHAMSSIQEAKQSDSIESEQMNLDEAIEAYREAHKVAHEKGLSEIEGRIEAHIKKADTIVDNFAEEEDVKRIMHEANELIEKGENLLEENNESAMRAYIKAGKLYLSVQQMARSDNLKQTKQIESTLSEIRNQIQSLEIDMIQSHFDNGLYSLGENSLDEAKRAYSEAKRAIEDYAINLPRGGDEFRWRTASGFYRPILDIIDSQMEAAIEGFEKGYYEETQAQYDALRYISESIEEKAKEEGMDDIMRESQIITDVCGQNSRMIQNVMFNEEDPEDISLVSR